MAPVSFFTAPRQYIHWASRAKPAIFWSMILGSMGPVFVVQTIAERQHCVEGLMVWDIACGTASPTLLWRWTEAADTFDVPE